MNLKYHKLLPLKYLTIFSVPLLCFWSFQQRGWETFIPVLYAFGFIPLLELLLKPNPANFSETDEKRLLKNPLFDFVVYLAVPVQFVCLFAFLQFSDPIRNGAVSTVGNILSMGLLCGIFGINVAHELGHRVKGHERFMAKLLLMTSWYMHFIVEHNKGHHRRVATPADPASSRLGENLYAFWYRSVTGSFLSAWHIESEILQKAGFTPVSHRNKILQFLFIQALFTLAIFFIWGFTGFLLFMAAAISGFLLLETVNYIEHYGLERQKGADGKYERVQPHHSWNSDHPLGRLLLFELSRHSDHHYLASRKYQILRHFDESPQMPTGYPGMMILSLFPPLWFRIVHPRLAGLKRNGQLSVSSNPKA